MPELPNVASIAVQHLPELVVGAIFVYAAIVLLVTAFLLVSRLIQARLRLVDVVTGQQLAAAFAEARLARLRSRIIDLAPSERSGPRDTILLNAPFSFAPARREIAHLYRYRLMRVQFFTALSLLLAIAAVGWMQERTMIPNLGITFAAGVAFVAALALLFFGILGRLAIDVAAEPLLEGIYALPLERLDLRLLRDIRAASDRLAVGSSSAVTSSPIEAIGPVLQQLAHSLEQDRHGLRQFAAQLFETAETLTTTTKIISDRPIDAAQAERLSGLSQELKAAIDRLTSTIDHLAAKVELAPSTPLSNGADSSLTPLVRLNGSLREELGALLKDFE